MIHIIWILFVIYRILTYLLFFENYFHYNIYDIILIRLHHTAGAPRCPFLIFTIHLSFLRPINRDYSRLSFDYITYYANNTGKSCVLMIYRHKGKWNSLILILLLFFLSNRKHVQDTTRWLFITALHLVKSFVWFWSVLINTVIIVTYFVWGQHSVFVITIVTWECNILIPQKLLFCVCHQY